MFEVEDVHWWFVSRRNFIAQAFDRMGVFTKSTSVIADIGAGTGGMIAFLQRYGAVIGVEPSIVGRSLAKSRGVTLRNGNAEKTGLRTASCDVVCLFDVLYHKGVDNDMALREAYRVVKKGGHVVITDCAMPFLYGPNDHAVGGRERYTISMLEARVKKAGFSIRFSSYLFFLLFPIFVAKRLSGKLVVRNRERSDVRMVHSLINVVLIYVCIVEAFILRFVRFPWGSSLILIGQK